MSKILIRISIFIAILVVFKLLELGLVVTNLNANDASTFYGRTTGKPRIILVGSSNLDFNYDYELLNETIEEYDVIGCNLNEPSGLYATVHKLKKLKPTDKDILIFVLPHSLYEPTKLITLGSSGKKGFTPQMLKESFSDFPMKFVESVVDIKTSDMIKLLEEGSPSGEVYDSIQFKDVTEADELPDFLDCTKLDGSFDIMSTGFDEEYLTMVHEYLHETFQTEIWFRFPVVKESEFVVDQKRLNFLSTNYKFLNEFDSTVYSDEFWYNQWYHLNFCGRELNTDKLISEITTLTNQ